MVDSYPSYYRFITESNPGERFDILSASSLGDLRLVQMMLNKGVDANSRNESGWTSLMYAANYGHYNVIRILLDRGGDPNLQENVNGQTALMLAASNGHTRCLEVLINHGKAHLDMLDNAGHNAAYYAMHCGHGSNKIIIKLLGIKDSTTPRKITGNRPKIMVSKASLDQGTGSIKSNLSPHSSVFMPKKGAFGANNNVKLTPNTNELIPFIHFASINDNVKHGAIGDGRYDVTPRNGSNSSTNKRRLRLNSHQKNPNDSTSPMSDSSITSNGSNSGLNSPPLPQSLEKLLSRIGLSSYIDIFNENSIDLHTFLTLTEADLKLIGVVSLGHRKKMCAAQSRFLESIEIKDTQERLFADWLLNERDQLRTELSLLKAENEKLMSLKHQMED